MENSFTLSDAQASQSIRSRLDDFENGDKRFSILAVNNIESVDAVTKFRKQMELTFPLVMDEKGAIQKTYGVVSYPSTFILNREGVIIARQFGPLTADQIDELVTRALAT